MNSPTFHFSKMKHNNIVVLTSISNININKKTNKQYDWRKKIRQLKRTDIWDMISLKNLKI